MVEEQDSPLEEDDTQKENLPHLFSGWLGALGERFRTVADLAFAETRLAVSTFMLMIFLSVLAAGALLFAWALLLYSLAQWPITMGYSPVAAALALVVAHVLLAWVLWRSANALGDNMSFEETRRVLNAAVSANEESEDNDNETV